VTLDESRLAAVRSAKLGALVADLTGTPPDAQIQAASESAIVACLVGDRAFVLADAISDLGPAWHWFARQDAAMLTVLAESGVAEDLARRASLVNADIEIMAVAAASARPADVAPSPTVPEISDELWRTAAVIADTGARVVDDNGRLTGEVRGLEVARVEPDDHALGSPRIQVGVGQADRELHGYVHGHLDDQDRLRRAVEVVLQHRRAGAALHPLTRLARPRWIRSELLSNPAAIGLTDLEPQAPVRPTAGVFDREPATAYSRPDRVTVVCSAGVDLDLLPEAVDVRARIDPESRLILALPSRDVALATGSLLESVPNSEVRAVTPPWE